MLAEGDIKIFGDRKSVLSACLDCGKQRWVQLNKDGRAKNERCKSCAAKLRPVGNPFPIGELNPMWRGGKRVDKSGYIRVRVYPDDSFSPMVDCRGYIKEHRLVMAQYLNRCLKSDEVVHHKDRNRHNNDISNLELMDDKTHYPIMHFLERIKQLEDEVVSLKLELEKSRRVQTL